MTGRCRKLDLDDAEPGMVLSAPVLDMHGGVLLPEATTLTDALLTSLRRRGIDSVLVIDDDISEEELKAERERVHARLVRLEQLFRRCQTGGACGALRQAIAGYRTGDPQ